MSAQGSSDGRVSRARRAWRVVRWPLLILVVAYVGLVVWRGPAVLEKQRSEQTVALIQSRHLTLNDVDGKHLPPPPDPKLVDATVAGVDANANSIRDDVELAIFKKYPNSPYTRSAELQYAMTLQMELTQVFDTDTLIAAIQEASRGHSCVSDSVPNLSASPTGTEIKQISALMDARIKEVEDLVFNTASRKQKREENFTYEASHGDINGPDCDIDLGSLPN